MPIGDAHYLTASINIHDLGRIRDFDKERLYSWLRADPYRLGPDKQVDDLNTAGSSSGIITWTEITWDDSNYTTGSYTYPDGTTGSWAKAHYDYGDNRSLYSYPITAVTSSGTIMITHFPLTGSKTGSGAYDWEFDRLEDADPNVIYTQKPNYVWSSSRSVS